MSFSRALPFAVLLACGEAESPRREPGDLALQPDRPADVSATADAAQRPDLGAVPDSATDAAPDLAHAFDAAPPGLTFSPAGRVVDLVLPDNPAHAATLGCAVEARNNGSSLAAVVSLVAQGGLAPLVERKPDGSVDLVIAIQAAGDKAMEPGPVQMRALYGGAIAGREDFSVDPASLAEDGLPRMRWPVMDTPADGRFHTQGTTFTLSLSFGPEFPPLNLVLQAATLRGIVSADGPGIALNDGFLEGYFSATSIRGLITELVTLCATEPEPSFCGGAIAVLGGAEEPNRAFNIIVGLIGGFDAIADEASGRACSAGNPDCNAVGVCLKLRAEGVTLVSN